MHRSPRNRFPARLSLAFCTAVLGLACGGGTPGTSVAAVATTPPVPDPAVLVTVEAGTLPVVLSVPHGGTTLVAGVPERTSPGATTVMDTNTLELGLAVQAQLVALTGKRAHLVAARVSRKHVDFNRTAQEAYDVPAMAPVFAFYHGAILTGLRAAKAQSAAGALLIDIHGQGTTPGTVYRGTQNGSTADLATLCRTSPNGLLAEMAAQNLAVSPLTASGSENASYTGGYIVVAHGFPEDVPDRVNAVQLEFGMDYRSPSAALQGTAAALAAAILAHLRAAGLQP